jgi:predicted TIM-barrel fold metal-dependent hydrolase
MPDTMLPTSMPPDPNPRRPTWTPPPGATDTHFHVLGPPHRFPFVETRRYNPPAAPFEHWEMMAAAIGVERGVIVQPTAHGVDNAAIMDAVARSRGRLRAVVSFDRSVPDDELARLKAQGAVGVRFSLMSDRPGATADIEAALPRIQKLGWSLDLHIEPKFLLANEAFIRALPAPVIFDHMCRVHPPEGPGQPAMQLMLDLLRDGGYWVKVSCADKISGVREARTADGSLPYRDVVPFAAACIEANPGRILWGTDWPHGNNFKPGRVPNDGDLMSLLGEFAPDDATRRRILVDNPAALYGFD